MRTLLLAAAVLLSSLPPAVALAEEAPIPKEGSYTTQTAGSATSKALPLGKERLQMTWEYLGVQTVVSGKGLTDKAAVRCLGSLRALNADVESSTNSCVVTRSDGDQLFWVETLVSGRMGGESKGTATIVGGTGKLAGITGAGEWSRQVVGRAAEGTFQTLQTSKITYKLP
jgi:hypothetical protein